MHNWVIAEPRLAFKDHVHLSDVGYGRWADALSGALLEEYARWRHANNLAASRPVTPIPPRTAPATPKAADPLPETLAP
jgi:hypothetical protein